MVGSDFHNASPKCVHWCQREPGLVRQPSHLTVQQGTIHDASHSQEGVKLPKKTKHALQHTSYNLNEQSKQPTSYDPKWDFWEDPRWMCYGVKNCYVMAHHIHTRHNSNYNVHRHRWVADNVGNIGQPNHCMP